MHLFFSMQLLPAEFQLKHSSVQGALMCRVKDLRVRVKMIRNLKIRDRFGGGGNKVVVKAVLA